MDDTENVQLNPCVCRIVGATEYEACDDIFYHCTVSHNFSSYDCAYPITGGLFDPLNRGEVLNISLLCISKLLFLKIKQLPS